MSIIAREYGGVTTAINIDHNSVTKTGVPGGNWKLHEVRIKLSAVPTTSENLVATIGGQDYYLIKEDPSTWSDPYLIYHPSCPHFINAEDYLKIDYTNTDARTWYVEVVWSNR